MKKFLYILMAMAALSSCNGGGSSAPKVKKYDLGKFLFRETGDDHLIHVSISCPSLYGGTTVDRYPVKAFHKNDNFCTTCINDSLYELMSKQLQDE